MATRNTANSDTRTEIQAGTKVKGKVQGSEDLWVAGRVEGSVELDGALTVAPGGVVKAEVRAVRVTVAGTVVGDVTASELIELTAQARVQGDLRAPTVRVDDGAKLNGLLEVGDVSRVEVAPRPAAPKTTQPQARPEPPEAHHKTTVTGFVPNAVQDDRRRKRVVVKKRG
ncbi:MAG: polymer-forming cytoskeletal protein [Myxococcales bacterium]|nr:polymer-forming cytoskeletal protein [Myxococcales bacterium]MCB9645541.1 polymer-forming cytoskeletal protein [Deltaproteobacteria bacterium]